MKILLDKNAAGIVIPQVELTGPQAALTVDLILDTGAAYTMIGWDTAITLGYDPARRSKSVPIVTANGKIHVPMNDLVTELLDEIAHFYHSHCCITQKNFVKK